MSNPLGDDGGGMLLVEAIEALKASWNTGESSISSIGSQLKGRSKVETLLQLVFIDSELAIQARQRCSVDNYITIFPDLKQHRATIETHIDKLRVNVVPDDNKSIGMFSRASVDQTINHLPRNKVSDNSDRPIVNSIENPSAFPKSISSYRILQELGRGSFGQVLLAEDPRLSRKVAIKIQDKKNTDVGLSDAFLHEARAIARLEHPNIVRLLHVDETTDGLGYLVYEYVSGTTLADRVKLANYTIDQAVQWIIEIAGALDFAHRRGVIHRDVSPRNIMIDASGTARLLDFGLSRLDEVFHTPDEDRILGTPNFMSPEQASGKPHWATSHADLFSLGSVLYYTLTNKLPFQGSSIFDVCERVQSATPQPPRSLRQDISPELESVVSKAMAKEPQLRYSTGADLAAALKRSAAPKPNPINLPQSDPSPRYVSTLLALIMIVVGIGTLAWAKKNYDDSLPLPELSKVSITIVRDGEQIDLLTEAGLNHLPISEVDGIQLSWQLLNGSSLKAKQSLLMIGGDPSLRDVRYPLSLVGYRWLASEGEPSKKVVNDLFHGKSLVVLCISPSLISQQQLEQLPSPWKSNLPQSLDKLGLIVQNAPSVMNEIDRLPKKLLLSENSGVRIEMLPINEAFKEELQELGVQSYFGVVIDRTRGAE